MIQILINRNEIVLHTEVYVVNKHKCGYKILHFDSKT